MIDDKQGLLTKDLLNLDEKFFKLSNSLEKAELQNRIENYFNNNLSWNDTCIQFQFTNNKFWRREL